MAGAAAHPAARAVSVDVGHARRYDGATGRPDAPDRPRHGPDRRGGAAGAASLLVVAGDVARVARGAGADRPSADLRRPLHAGLRAGAGSVAALREALHA